MQIEDVKSIASILYVEHLEKNRHPSSQACTILGGTEKGTNLYFGPEERVWLVQLVF